MLQTHVLPALSYAPLVPNVSGAILVVHDDPQAAAAIATAFTSRGLTVELAALRQPPIVPAAAAISGMLLLAARAIPADHGQDTITADDDALCKASFAWMQFTSASLRAAAEGSGACFLTISAIDGAFGLRDSIGDCAQGGLAGLAKTAAREWPRVGCRALDIDPRWTDPAEVAHAILAEMCDCLSASPESSGSALEVGLSQNGRLGLQLADAPLSGIGQSATNDARPGSDAMAARPDRGLPPGEVALVTGGARGVTAEAALALAHAWQPTLVLLGRSAPPQAEPEWLAGISAPAEMKRAIIAHDFVGRRALPADVEAAYRRHTANREINANLRRISDAGSRVVYRAVDLRDAAATRKVIAGIQAEFGEIGCVIHGAGVLQDKRIEDKTAEQFSLVVDTKVSGLRNVFAAVDAGRLRNLVLFSSVTGRFGRQGQCDYAAANEMLNKFGRAFARRHPHCRVSAINWGPWEGGMVNDALRREFQKSGVPLIPLDQGARAMVEEMQFGDDSVEVIIGNGFGEDDAADAAPTSCRASNCSLASDGASREVTRLLSLTSDPYLSSHVIGGRAVVPLAMMMEWFAKAAADDTDSRNAACIENMRVLRGITLKDAPYRIRVIRTRSEKNASTLELHGIDDGRDVLHARATVVMPPPVTSPPEHSLDSPPPQRGDGLDADAVYAILFHGSAWQCIRRVVDNSRARIMAQIDSSIHKDMFGDADAAPRLDVMGIDAALQLGILWTHRHLGKLSLPAFVGRFTPFNTSVRGSLAMVTLSVRQSTEHKLIADVNCHDSQGGPLWRMSGVEWTADASLASAFGRRVLAEAIA